MQTFKLVLSALVSSWQFFKEATPSPCIEFALHTHDQDETSNWQKLNLRPEKLSLVQTVKSIFFNPSWNEALYIMDFAEILVIDPSKENSQKLRERIEAQLRSNDFDFKQTPYLRFRIIFFKDVLFTSTYQKVSKEQA